MTDRPDSEHRTVLLHFNRRGDSGDAQCVAWPRAEFTLAQVSFGKHDLEIAVSLEDDALAFSGVFYLPYDHVTQVDVVAGCLVIQTRGSYLPRLVIRVSSNEDAAALCDRVTKALTHRP